MAEHYSRAPIIEAVIDLRLKLPETETVGVFDLFREELAQEFPVQEDFVVATAEVQFNENPTSSITNKHVGFRLVSKDKRSVIIATLESFTFSRLSPYENWEAFKTEAHTYWVRYREIAHPVSVNRLGVRYINRVDLPISQRIHSYLKLYPMVPPIPNQSTLGFFMQLQVPQPDINSTLIINEGRVESPNPETMSVLFDIDLFSAVSWDANDDQRIWSLLDQLRMRKNEVFEASITQKTRELIS